MKKFMLSLILVTPLVCKSVNPTGFISERYKRCENDEVVCYVLIGSRRGGLSCKFKEEENVHIPSNISVSERESSGELQKSELLYNEFRGLPRE